MSSVESELLSLCHHTVDLLHYRPKVALQHYGKISYESGNKCGKILAKSVRGHRLTTYIPQISPSGHRTVLPNQIVKEFRDFYSSLYNLPEGTASRTSMEDYITSSQKLWKAPGLGWFYFGILPIPLPDFRPIYGKVV